MQFGKVSLPDHHGKTGPRVWTQVQSLSEDLDRSNKPLWRYGRLFVHFWNKARKRYRTIEFCWKTPTDLFMISLEKNSGDGGDEWCFVFACGLVFLCLSVPMSSPGEDPVPSREWRLSFHESCLWWAFGTPVDDWNISIPFSKYGSFSFSDFFFGKPVFSRQVLETRQTVVSMPEKDYPCTATLFLDSWKRPRAFSSLTIKRVDISIPGGVPFPGKATASYNQGLDGIFETTLASSSIEAAINSLQDEVTDIRQDRGWDSQNLPTEFSKGLSPQGKALIERLAGCGFHMEIDGYKPKS